MLRVIEKKVLYIAKNIPIPQRRNNSVLFTIGERLLEWYSIDFLYPSEYVPIFLRYHKKFSSEYGLRRWKRNDFEISVYKYLRLPTKKWAFRFAKLMPIPRRYKDYALIHAHYGLPDGLIAYQIYKNHGTPYIVSIRASDIDLLIEVGPEAHTYRLFREILANTNAIHVLNLSSKSFIEKAFNVPTYLIPHGIDESDFLPKQNKNEVVRICTVANLNKGKCVDWVILAVNELTKSIDVELIVIGDGSEKERLTNLASKNKRIQFLGKLPRKDVLEYLSISDIFALPSQKETFGLVYLEAAANNCAIIGYKGQGIYGVLKGGIEALYPSSYDEFKSCLYKLISDENLRATLSQNAHNKCKELTWSKIIEKYRNLYDSALRI